MRKKLRDSSRYSYLGISVYWYYLGICVLEDNLDAQDPRSQFERYLFLCATRYFFQEFDLKERKVFSTFLKFDFFAISLRGGIAGGGGSRCDSGRTKKYQKNRFKNQMKNVFYLYCLECAEGTRLRKFGIIREPCARARDLPTMRCPHAIIAACTCLRW